MAESIVTEHRALEDAETNSSKKGTEQEPLDFKAWASARFCIPDDGRFRFPFSRTGLEYMLSTGRKTQAEKITQDIHDLFSNEGKKGNNELRFTCADYYEGIDGETRLESIRFSAADGLEIDDPVTSAEMKGGYEMKFQRFMCVLPKPSFSPISTNSTRQILGLDFADNAYHLFSWKSELGDSFPNMFGTQTRPSYTTSVGGGFCGDSYLSHKTVSFVLTWYTCGFGKVKFSNLNQGPLYGRADGMQLVQKRIEVSRPDET